MLQIFRGWQNVFQEFFVELNIPRFFKLPEGALYLEVKRESFGVFAQKLHLDEAPLKYH